MIEFKIVYYLNHLGQGTFLDVITKFVSSSDSLILLWIALALISLIFDKRNGKLIFLGSLLIIIIYLVLNDLIIKQGILEHIFYRQRPYISNPTQIFPLGDLWKDSSFPSGHMANTLAFITFYIYFYRKYWTYILGIVLAFLMAFSRMHNGMHYPSDVFVGSLFGIGYGFLVVYVINKIRSKIQKSPEKF
ncbi:MAG: family phosphohydrolase [Candidatus Berkelbacteria bacterium]|nr:family phosphohydrolase [Candidatus Berkelbacteria bacterium]